MGEPVMSGNAGRYWLVLLLAIVAGGVLWAGWKSREGRRHRWAMAAIGEEMVNGLHGTAARKLMSLLAQQPDWDEALYFLGTCEMARGRTQAASEAWARVPPGSPLAPQAILGRIRIETERGRLAEAEQIIRNALEDPRIDGSTLAILVGPFYCKQGRLEEALRMVESRWEALNLAGEGNSEPAINLVRAHIDLRRSPVPTEVVGSALDQAARMAPEDDRIWLGRANLAIRAGSYDEAERWIDACLRRRPEDAPVWRARLDWAVAANRVAEVRDALKHLSVEVSTPAQIHKLAAWFAARRGDVQSERRALERVIAADPADFVALDRLAELAVKNGQPDRAAGLRREKAESERRIARYQQLHVRHQPSRDAAEMARLAEQLGQRFEAKAFLTLAVAIDPDRDDLRRDLGRVNQRADTNEGPGRTLADLLAPELGDDQEPSAPLTPRLVNP
jgi:enediyne biosynthesis protein E4